MGELPYEEQPRLLNLFILERRHFRRSLVLANSFYGIFDFPQAEFLETPAKRNPRGHDLQLRHRYFRLL